MSDDPRGPVGDGAADGLDRLRERAAANQAIFRSVNENLEALNSTFRSVIPVGDFVCECADASCAERIGLTTQEYEAVRAHPTYFAVRPGHMLPEVERVVSEHPGYVVVEKVGVAGEDAAESDPRS